MAAPLIICSCEGAWNPAISRPHALALVAASHGHAVTFVERPTDIRSALKRSTRAAWGRGLLRGIVEPVATNLSVMSWSTVVPGHRGVGVQLIDNRLMIRQLRGHATAGATIVAQAPWQWHAVTAIPVRRRVFDCGDDWAALMPHRSDAFHAIYRQIAEEADAVVVVSDRLSDLFPGAPTIVVKNGVDENLLSPPVTESKERVLIYAGTLSERLDTPLVAGALDKLPGWRMDLYGRCRYAHRGDEPGPELEGFLGQYRGRVEWHGSVDRNVLATALDRGSVMVAPLRPQLATGDLLKFYDYAARGRPIVTTKWRPDIREIGPPHLYLGDTSDELAAAIEAAFVEPRSHAADRRAWAAQQTWGRRWPRWSQALFPSGP